MRQVMRGVHSGACSDLLELLFLFHFSFVSGPLLLRALALLQLQQRELVITVPPLSSKPAEAAPAATRCRRPRLWISAAGLYVADEQGEGEGGGRGERKLEVNEQRHHSCARGLGFCHRHRGHRHAHDTLCTPAAAAAAASGCCWARRRSRPPARACP
jgi:hypothetical protein